MMMMFLFIVLVISMVIVLIRTAKGPDWIDRVLAINVFGTLTVLLLTLISGWEQIPSLIDIALLYVLINFMGTVAILRFFQDKKLPVFRQRQQK